MSEQLEWRIAPGTIPALTGRDDDRAYWIFEGDLNQMGIIQEVLKAVGFDIVKNDVYPGFPKDQEEEYKRALRFIWDYKIPGWWNQRRKLIQYEICTEEQYQEALPK